MSEASEQITVVQYCDFKKIPIFAIPNGGKRNKREAAYMKKQGVRAGVPDLLIPVARHGFHGLFIELKFEKNRPSTEQEEWLDILNKNGYCAVVCWGFDGAQKAIDAYFSEE